MSEICVKVKIPDELRKWIFSSDKYWKRMLETRANEEIRHLVEVEKIVAKSKLTQKQADRLAEKVKEGMAKRHEALGIHFLLLLTIEKPKQARWEYDEDNDELNISFKESKSYFTTDLGSGLMVKYIKDSFELVGITIFGLKKTLETL